MILTMRPVRTCMKGRLRRGADDVDDPLSTPLSKTSFGHYLQFLLLYYIVSWLPCITAALIRGATL